MKKILFVMLASLFVTSIGFAQTMSEVQRKEFEAWQEFQKVKGGKMTPAEQVSKYAGLGKEVGIALNEAVQALDKTATVTEDHVYKFTATPAGKLTVGIIVWKYIGTDALRLFLGIVFLSIMGLWIRFWVKTLFIGRTVMDKQVGKEKTYIRIDPLKSLSSDVYTFYSAVFIVGSVAFFVASCIAFCNVG